MPAAALLPLGGDRRSADFRCRRLLSDAEVHQRQRGLLHQPDVGHTLAGRDEAAAAGSHGGAAASRSAVVRPGWFRRDGQRAPDYFSWIIGDREKWAYSGGGGAADLDLPVEQYGEAILTGGVREFMRRSDRESTRRPLIQAVEHSVRGLPAGSSAMTGSTSTYATRRCSGWRWRRC